MWCHTRNALCKGSSRYNIAVVLAVCHCGRRPSKNFLACVRTQWQFNLTKWARSTFPAQAADGWTTLHAGSQKSVGTTLHHYSSLEEHLRILRAPQILRAFLNYCKGTQSQLKSAPKKSEVFSDLWKVWNITLACTQFSLQWQANVLTQHLVIRLLGYGNLSCWVIKS